MVANSVKKEPRRFSAQSYKTGTGWNYIRGCSLLAVSRALVVLKYVSMEMITLIWRDFDTNYTA